MPESERVVAEFQLPIPIGATPRPPTDSEVDGWLEAASYRRPPAASDAAHLRAWLARRNPRSYNKLITLMRWAEKEYAEEFGMLPEDVRWILP